MHVLRNSSHNAQASRFAPPCTVPSITPERSHDADALLPVPLLPPPDRFRVPGQRQPIGDLAERWLHEGTSMNQVWLSTVERDRECPFPELLERILQTCADRSTRRNKTQDRILRGRAAFAHHLLLGLSDLNNHRAWKLLPQRDMGLFLPLSEHGYTERGPLKGHSHTAATEVVEALCCLGMIHILPGRYEGDKNIQSELRPTERFLKTFPPSVVWRPRKPQIKDPIILKNYDVKTKKSNEVSFAHTPETRAMRNNLLRINRMLLNSCIALAVDEYQLWRMSQRMAARERVLNLDSVELRRIFARKSFDLGGRFYGGWWQNIPSAYRRYITLNGLPTVEVDFATLHPLLLYAHFKTEPPREDFYDLGLATERKRTRAIVKQIFNAILCADSDFYRPEKDDLKFIKLSNAELRNKLFDKHPPLKKARGAALGLRFQNTDAKIAEFVMLELLDQSIISLPVHDSFIVAAAYEHQLKETMDRAYARFVGGVARFKESERFIDTFSPAFYPSGQIDLTYDKNLHRSSPYHRYVDSYAAVHRNILSV